MTSYDEDLRHNPFHRRLNVDHPDLLEKAAQENWIICVPRRDSLPQHLTTDDIFDHILVDSKHTLRKTSIELHQDYVYVKKSSAAIKILFKETFYVASKQLKYMIYCVDGLLNCPGVCKRGDLVTLKDCIEFLKDVCGAEVLVTIGETCEEFLLIHEDLLRYSLQELKDLCNVLFNKCFLLGCKVARDDERMVKVAVEVYMQHCLNGRVFDAISYKLIHADGSLNKMTRNLQHIQIEDLDLAEFQGVISAGKYELGKINKTTTTLDKLHSLKQVFKVFSGSKELLTTEIFVPLLSFTILHTNINNWISNLLYLQQFRFSANSMVDEDAFLLTTFEAAIEFVKNGGLKMIDSSHGGEVLKTISSGDLRAIKTLFNDDNAEQIKLCHPLCTCDKCTRSFNEYSINWCDDKGRNGLHLACIYGFPYAVDYFIGKQVDVSAVDYLGSNGVHYACSRGHQNALLLLLHAGVDLNKGDGDDNTPLHLATQNGHENCVKALLYYAEHAGKFLDINAQNLKGDTPLHLASKWSYTGIIKTLVQYNARTDLRNKKGERITDLSRNFFTLNKTEPEIDNHNYGVCPKNLQQHKKIELLIKAIQNNDVPLCCFYLGIPTPVTSPMNPTLCHPLCTCNSCIVDSVETDSFIIVPNDSAINVNTCNTQGLTPLHAASKYGHKEILRLLLDSGANINLHTYRNLHTPLHLACINSRLDCVKELLQSGNCNVDAKDINGCTALHHACVKNDLKIIDVLLTRGCDVNVRNNEGKNVLRVARDLSLWGVERLVKEKCGNNLLTDDDL